MWVNVGVLVGVDVGAGVGVDVGAGVGVAVGAGVGVAVSGAGVLVAVAVAVAPPFGSHWIPFGFVQLQYMPFGIGGCKFPQLLFVTTPLTATQ